MENVVVEMAHWTFLRTGSGRNDSINFYQILVRLKMFATEVWLNSVFVFSYLQNTK